MTEAVKLFKNNSVVSTFNLTKYPKNTNGFSGCGVLNSVILLITATGASCSYTETTVSLLTQTNMEDFTQ